MPAYKRQVAAGNQRSIMWYINGFGFPTGGSPSDPSQGAAGSSAILIRGIKTSAPAIPNPDTVQVTGDDDLIAEFYFNNIGSRGFEITYSIEDLDVLATHLGIILQNWGEARVAIMDNVNAPERDMGFVFQSRAKKQDSGVAGQKAWGGLVVPLSTYTPLGRVQFEERGAAVFHGYVVPQLAGYDPFGITIQSSQYGTSGGRLMPFTSEYPLMLHAHRGNGALSTFTLDYKPISAAKTAAVSNRVALTVSSVATSSPYSETFGSTPAGAAAITTIYEHDAAA